MVRFDAAGGFLPGRPPAADVAHKSIPGLRQENRHFLPPSETLGHLCWGHLCLDGGWMMVNAIL